MPAAEDTTTFLLPRNHRAATPLGRSMTGLTLARRRCGGKPAGLRQCTARRIRPFPPRSACRSVAHRPRRAPHLSRPTGAPDHQVRYRTSDGSADGLVMPATVHADTSDKRMRSESCSTWCLRRNTGLCGDAERLCPVRRRGRRCGGDIVGIISGEKVGDVVAEVFTGHRYARRDSPGQVQRHFDADGTSFGVDVSQDRVGPDSVRVRYVHVRDRRTLP